MISLRLKALGSIGNQGPVFSLIPTYAHNHKPGLNWSQKFAGLKYFYLFIWVRNYLFLNNYVTSEGAVSYNVLYYQQLSIARLSSREQSFSTITIILFGEITNSAHCL